jgi:predicted nucleic acid-binding protein
MMVLVDTSVWIRFLANRAPYAGELERLLSLDAVATHDLVFGELLIGDRGSGRGEFLDAYRRLPPARVVPHTEVVEFVRARNLRGRGAGWIDIHLLASALIDRFQLWTVDSRIAALANELGVGYE